VLSHCGVCCDMCCVATYLLVPLRTAFLLCFVSLGCRILTTLLHGMLHGILLGLTSSSRLLLPLPHSRLVRKGSCACACFEPHSCTSIWCVTHWTHAWTTLHPGAHVRCLCTRMCARRVCAHVHGGGMRAGFVCSTLAALLFAAL